MIVQELTDSQRKLSQKYFLGYNFLNGMGYMCIGDMVMMLLANRLGFPDVVFTILSALFNIGYLWLPLGKIATEKWGAAKTQSNFWILRNIAAVTMASCAIWGIFGYKTTAGVFLLGGAFVFYGCRAAGTVMTTALMGNITTEKDRGKLLAFASMAHNIMTAITVMLLALLLHYSKSLWTLYAIVLYGAFCGVLSAICLRKVDESDALQEAAKKPLVEDAWSCLKDDVFRRMVIGQVCYSLATAMTISLNMLILKRGYNISDSLVLLINFASSFLSVAIARPVSKLGDHAGPRKAMLIGFCINFLVIIFWQISPNSFNWGAVLLLFAMSSFCSLCAGICHGQYFLKAIPVRHQPSASTLLSLINGVMTGFIAMFLTTLLWKGCDHFLGADITGMVRYRMFFRLAAPFVLLCFIGVWRQREV